MKLDYEVLRSNDIYDIVKEACSFLKSGWRLHGDLMIKEIDLSGGHCCSKKETEEHFYQAMVKSGDIQEYSVIFDKHLYYIEKEVSSQIKDGWELYGALIIIDLNSEGCPCCGHDSTDMIFRQVMIKEER